MNDSKLTPQPFAGTAPPPLDLVPARTARFMHPDDVSGATHLTRAERREILASWASDARAVPDAPTLRQLDNGSVVRLDDIRRALIALDGSGHFTSLALDPNRPRYLRRRPAPHPAARSGRTGHDDDDDDPPPCLALNGGPHRGPLSDGHAAAPGPALAA